MRRLPFLCLLAALSAAGCDDAAPVRAGISAAEAMSGDTTGYARADRVRPFVFPADHGPHPDFKTEWWYVTGSLDATDGSGRTFGVQLTVFRSALAPESSARGSAWATRQLYMAHVAVGDVATGRFYDQERFARGAAGLAGATAEPVRVWLGPVELAQDGALGENGAVPLRLRGSAEGAAVDLVARPAKPLVLQGDRGLSPKGPGDGNASYYYAQTRMATTGTITLPPARPGGRGEAVPVEGLTWLDREWSTSALAPGQVGWDWFALHLDAPGGDGDASGRDLMVFQVRQADGREGAFSDAALVDADGARTRLDADDVSLTPVETWTSPRGGTYPVRWRIRVPSQNLDLDVRAAMPDQELDATVRYWEGRVSVGGTASGTGFLEMTGYVDEATRTRGR